MSKGMSTAQARTKRATQKWDLVQALVARSCGDPCGLLSKKRSLHDLAQLLWRCEIVQVLLRRSCGDPGEVLSKRSLHDLVQILVRRSCGDPDALKSSLIHPCMILYRSLCEDLVEIRVKSSLVQVLVRRSWSKILWVSFYDLYRSFWEDLVEILFKSSQRSLAFRSWRCSARSCAGTQLTKDLVEILVRSFSRGPCMNILQVPCVTGASMKAYVGGSWEVLVSRSCELSFSSSRSLWRSCELLFGGLAWRASSICQGLLQVLASSSCGDPSDMLLGALAWPCAGPCAKLLKRPW